MENTVKEYMVELSDGTRLYTVVQQPGTEGRFPVIVIRTPYAPTASCRKMLIFGPGKGEVFPDLS